MPGRIATTALVTAWMRSPDHRRVLLSRAYRVIGVGVAQGMPVGSAARGATYAALLGG